MEEALVFWILLKKGAKRGYTLPKKEWKEFIPYSDEIMFKKYEKWQKGLRREAGNRGHLIF